jgi:SPP1 family predicted phage head-tail adaptor
MMKADVVTLIAQSPEAHEAGSAPRGARREVFCTIRSIGMQEAYQAMGQGLNPELKVILHHDFEYSGESLCELGGVPYKILRTYITETDGIELTLQRVSGNSGSYTEGSGGA